MPSNAKSQNIDLSNYQRVESAAAPMMPQAVPPPPSEQAPSPFRVCSLPPIAAGLDQVTRQFYGQGMRQQRIFTPGLE